MKALLEKDLGEKRKLASKMKALLKEPSLEKKLREERRNFGEKRKLASKMKTFLLRQVLSKKGVGK